jgi:tRNA threonylcarbamoyladenosine biosynthesis protein TsaB
VAAVVIRARTGFWYLRLNGEEKFIETPEVIELLEKAQAKVIVADDAALADEALKATFEKLGASTVRDTGLPLDRWAPLFDSIKPSLIQEANYIQPSYFEKLKA